MDGILRAPVGHNRRPVVVRVAVLGQSTAQYREASGGGTVPGTDSKTAAATPWDRRGRFSADSQHPSAPISEAKV